MKFSRLFISGAMLAVTMANALASDLVPKAREKNKVEAPYNWSGFYIGINGGGGIGAGGASVTPFSALVPSNPADKMKGWMGGFQVGARNQSGMFLYGVEADFDWSSIENRASACSTARRTFFATQLADTTSCQSNGTKLQWLSTVTANAGIVLWERAVLSVLGGFAFGKVQTDNSQSVATTALTPTGVAFCNVGAISCPNGAGSASDSKIATGWTIGAAIEAALGGRWTAKAQYNFVDLGSINSAAMGNQHLDVHLVRFGLNMRF